METMIAAAVVAVLVAGSTTTAVLLVAYGVRPNKQDRIEGQTISTRSH